MLYDLYDCSLCVDVAVHMIRRNEMHLVPPASQLCVVSTCVSTGVDPTSFRSNFHSSCSCGANPFRFIFDAIPSPIVACKDSSQTSPCQFGCVAAPYIQKCLNLRQPVTSLTNFILV